MFCQRLMEKTLHESLDYFSFHTYVLSYIEYALSLKTYNLFDCSLRQNFGTFRAEMEVRLNIRKHTLSLQIHNFLGKKLSSFTAM